MDRSKLADYSEILSSIAIIVTLIYLVIEIGQNTDALHAQTRQSILQAAQAELMLLVENPDIALSIPTLGALTPEENVKLDVFLALTMRSREFSWIQYERGEIDETQWNSEVAAMRVILDSQRIRNWWHALGRNYASEEFAQYVDQLIQDQPATGKSWDSSAEWSDL